MHEKSNFHVSYLHPHPKWIVVSLIKCIPGKLHGNILIRISMQHARTLVDINNIICNRGHACNDTRIVIARLQQFTFGAILQIPRKSATPGRYSFSRRFHSHFRLVEFSGRSRRDRGNSVTISSFCATDSWKL